MIIVFDARSETHKQKLTKSQIQLYLAQAKEHLRQGDVENSLEFYFKASYLQQPWTLELASTHLKIAAILVSKEVYEAALAHLNNARDILQQIKQDPFVLTQCSVPISLIDQLKVGLRSEHSSREPRLPHSRAQPELLGDRSDAGTIPDIIVVMHQASTGDFYSS